MSSRCLRTLLLVLPLLAVACGDDSDGGSPGLTPPTVREIRPNGGPVAGNTLVNVYGSGFQDGAKAFLGNLELQRTVVVNAFRIYGYTPTATSVQMDVRVVNPDGAYGVLVKGFTYDGAPSPNIDQAEVLNGNSEAVSGGQPVGVPVRGAITVAGLTRGVGQAGSVRAQVGYAPSDAPLLNPDSYTWAEAKYETDSDSGEADIYRGTVLLQPPVGQESLEWVVTVRFSIDGGVTWAMADGDGTANGVSADMMRRVFISRPKVDYCKLGPDGNSANPELFYKPTDTTLIKVAGQVYAAGITQGSGAGSGVVAQLGYGPENSDPTKATGWTWVNATYKAEHGNNDEWEADLPNPGTMGKYSIAFRFSISENSWRVCDADGVNDSREGSLTFSLDKLGTLTVGNEAPKPAVTWCKIGEDAKDPEAVTYNSGAPPDLKTVYAQVGMPGVTDKPDAGPGLSGQLGWGPAGEDPRTSTRWNWTTQLVFNKDNFEVNDEWKGTLPNPGVDGEYRYAVRFSANGGPERVCDGNGTNGGDQPFELDKLGTLKVTGGAPPTTIGYCKLGPVGNTTPETLTYTTTATASHKVVGQVYVQGVTTTAGPAPTLVGQLGWGPAGQNPSSGGGGWTWTTTGAFKRDVGNDDEFEATLPNPGVASSYSFAYRFQVNNGAFLYCDADGNTGGVAGFETAKMGTLTVQDVQAPVGVCKLVSLNDGEVGSGDAVTATGHVRIPGVTDGAGAGANVQVQVGVGNADANASATPAAFAWTAAQYSREAPDVEATDEFTATFHPAYTGSRAVSMRYSTDGATWTYCDKNGSDVGGYSIDEQLPLAVGNPTDPTGPDVLDYCKMQWPFKTSEHGGKRDAYGRVYEKDVTNASEANPNIVAELGYGPKAQDPGVSADWTWVPGTFLGNQGEEDEYTATLPRTVPTGSAFVWRFRMGSGAYAYGDWQPDGQSGGSSNGANPEWLSTVDSEPLPE